MRLKVAIRYLQNNQIRRVMNMFNNRIGTPIIHKKNI